PSVQSSSGASPGPAGSSTSSGSVGGTKTFQVYLSSSPGSPGGARTYACVHCRAHLAAHADLISKSFQGSQGRAYLFDRVVNVTAGPAEDRQLLTGLHSVADIQCQGCRTVLGWKYERAFESSQRYKEGKTTAGTRMSPRRSKLDL
uniref:Protein yippee-like n=1 Tax=Macrostomum lignano TaxID=282301 RepID=A0A1I8GF81_9PLAT